MTKHISKHKSRRLRRFLKANEAVSALEYAILVGVVAAAIGTAIFALRDEIVKQIGHMETRVQEAGREAKQQN